MGERGGETSTGALRDFRKVFHRSTTSWGDALFELGDALVCASSPAPSAPGLSLEEVFRRSHGSLCKALALGGIDEDALRDLLVAHRPEGWPEVFAVDGSSWPRCDAETSPDRGFCYHPSRHSAGQPIVAGWSCSWVAQLDWEKSSWTAPPGARRIRPLEDTGAVTAEQVRDLVDRLGSDGPVPLFVFDAGYDPIGLSVDLADCRARILVRIRSDRVFYTDPPERSPGAAGRPRRHGERFSCADPSTWPAPDAALETCDPRYGRVEVSAWAGLHPRLAGRGRWAGHDEPPIVAGAVIRVEAGRLPKADARAKKTLWLWWSGPGAPDLDVAWRAYIRRFDIEHTLRFAKNTLGWTTPAPRTPEQADRWTWLVVAGLTQLRLARSLVDDLRLPWERPCPPDKLTPARVRRGFRRLRATIGTPASPPKSQTPGPGRPKGTRTGPRARYPPIKKAA
jgi:hypothetical protein